MPEDRRFGVEIEFNALPVDLTTSLLQRHGYEIENEDDDYRVGSDNAWRVVHESSVEDGAELNTPILSRNDPYSWQVIKDVMNIIRSDGRASIASNAGIHVHVETVDLSASSLLAIFRLLNHYSDGWQELVGHARGAMIRRESDTGYFGSMSHDLQNYLITNQHPGYHELELYQQAAYTRHNIMPSGFGIRCDSYPRQGTLEFRMHHGTLSGERICDWAGFVLDYVEYCKNNPNHMPSDNGDTRALLNVVSDSQLRQSLLHYPQPRHAREMIDPEFMYEDEDYEVDDFV